MSKINMYQSVLSSEYIYSKELMFELLEQLLSEKRYNHVCRVYEKALIISAQCDLSPEIVEKIQQAVLFHDFAKGMTSDELQEYADLYKIDLENSAPPIYHAIVGAWMANKYFHIHDQQILDAVRFHTTGNANFVNNIVGSVLFLADYLEPGREKDSQHIEKYIPKNLLMAQYLIVKEKIVSVIERNRVLSTESIVFYHELLKYIQLS